MAPYESTEREVRYAPALDGTGLIPLEAPLARNLRLGMTLSGGWDSNPGNLASGVPSGTFMLAPYLGLHFGTPKTQYLFQYHPIVTKFISDNYASQMLNVATARVVGNINERWSWDLDANATHGQDSTRLVAPQQTVAIGDIPGTGSSSASYLPNTGVATHAGGGIRIHYSKSQTEIIEFDALSSFSTYSGLTDSNGVTTTGFSYERALSPTFSAVTYAQSSYYYQPIQCMSLGGGFGVKWQMHERTSLSLSGGPQFNMSCGNQQGLSYSASFNTTTSRKSQIYLTASRQPGSSYLGPGLWQTNASAGYLRKVTNIGTLNFDVAYASSDTLKALSSYRGIYVDCIYSYRLGRGFNASYSYREYAGSWGGSSVNRHVALFSLTWTNTEGSSF
ncbi:MAG: hypothetical protein JWQ42_2500 [Edaphobacter sp.]|nr:hypothetical protein [Edaphobacter sp.]